MIRKCVFVTKNGLGGLYTVTCTLRFHRCTKLTLVQQKKKGTEVGVCVCGCVRGRKRERNKLGG